MSDPKYDQAADFYVAFVTRNMEAEGGFWRPLIDQHLRLFAADLPGSRVLDIACGEGHLSRLLAARGAGWVLGVDISAALLAVAAERTTDARVAYRLDDAQTLATLADASFDLAVSKLALMDIPDHRAMFCAVRRVLVPGGRFAFSLLHPCFEAPFHEPESPRFLLDERGERSAFVIREYVREGHWNSGGTGVRGTVGAYHRTLSTLVTDLLAAGFTLRGLHELTHAETGLLSQVPQTLLLEAQATGEG